MASLKARGAGRRVLNLLQLIVLNARISLEIPGGDLPGMSGDHHDHPHTIPDFQPTPGLFCPA